MKAFFRIIAVFITLIGTPGLLLAQSEFVDRKGTALGFSGSIISGPVAGTIREFDLGVSTDGKIDIGIFGESTSNGYPNNHGLGFYLDNFVLKQRRGGMPLSAGFSFGALSHSGNMVGLAAIALMKYFPLSRVFRIQPIISESFSIYSSGYDETNFTFQFSLPFIVRFKDEVIVFVGPVFADSHGFSAFGALFGMVVRLH